VLEFDVAPQYVVAEIAVGIPRDRVDVVGVAVEVVIFDD
jgi:hypothetical protein